MADLRGFDAKQVDPTLRFGPVPAARYSAVITKSVIKRTKAGTGKFLEMTFQILDGHYKDRLVWTRLNLENPSKRAVECAQAELSAICRAVGVLEPDDSSDLHGIPLVILVDLERRSDTGGITNVIRAYEAQHDDDETRQA